MRQTTRRLLSVAAAGLLASSLAACGSDSSSTAENPGNDSTPASGSPSSSGGSGTTCDYPADGTQPAKQVQPPPAQPTVTGKVTGTIVTNRGDLDFTLDADKTPCTVNSFVSLAGQAFYDDTPCHRLTTAGIFVLQCGDPSGTGMGGPGYRFADELKGDEQYSAGTLAMANAGPDTNGSQFFIVYADTPLPPSYTVFGSVGPEAVKAVKKVAAKGSDNANGNGDGAPNQSVTIERVTLDD